MASEHEGRTQPETDSTAEDSGIHWDSIIRNTALIIVLLVLLWLAFNVRLPSADSLQQMIASWGWAAWLVFIGTYALVALTPIPVTVMAVTGGLLFGTLEGSILSMIGVFIGCWGAYWIARGLGKQATARLLGSHYRTAERHLNQAGFQAVVMLRLLPGFPYWPVNYGSGAFGVSQRDFLLASALAIIPGQVSLVAIGSFISNPNVANGVVVGIGWAVVLVMTWWAYRRWTIVKDQSPKPAND
ncbi:TVP38/TMEM64 family protein [Enteractinococcus coprophilus]|uniref:TVP38/TMEM64 family membrane protein n=1 Tax=Enteractinococcus coprophilus TaxID=1027633 RepID=A0A543AFS2_9MICC|nr:VTT domain-containing protein [Enteractinococcus coprophilus]TQL71434.1 putative membrane protein YdjX (TVP38/TMEM64 family) [Enteractinococcus coprophilus]